MNLKHTLKVPKTTDLNEMTSDELRESLAALKMEKMKIDGSNKGDSANPIPHPSGQARQTRKTIARIMTILIGREERCV